MSDFPAGELTRNRFKIFTHHNKTMFITMSRGDADATTPANHYLMGSPKFFSLVATTPLSQVKEKDRYSSVISLSAKSLEGATAKH